MIVRMLYNAASCMRIILFTKHDCMSLFCEASGQDQNASQKCMIVILTYCTLPSMRIYYADILLLLCFILQFHYYHILFYTTPDFFRGPVVPNIRLQGLEHVIQFTAAEGKVFFRSYRYSTILSQKPRPMWQEFSQPLLDTVDSR